MLLHTSASVQEGGVAHDAMLVSVCVCVCDVGFFFFLAQIKYPHMDRNIWLHIMSMKSPHKDSKKDVCVCVYNKLSFIFTYIAVGTFMPSVIKLRP